MLLRTRSLSAVPSIVLKTKVFYASCGERDQRAFSLVHPPELSPACYPPFLSAEFVPHSLEALAIHQT